MGYNFFGVSTNIAQIKEITIVQRYMYIHSSLTFQQNVEQTNIILPSELPCPPSSWDSTF